MRAKSTDTLQKLKQDGRYAELTADINGGHTESARPDTKALINSLIFPTGIFIPDDSTIIAVLGGGYRCRSVSARSAKQRLLRWHLNQRQFFSLRWVGSAPPPPKQRIYGRGIYFKQ
jgi:hypothetical protein